MRLRRPFVVVIAAVVAGLFAAYLLSEIRQNKQPGFSLDDSWIHLTFAKHIAQGEGFAYNRGEPVAGSTAPLWTLVLAFFHLFTRNTAAMVIVAKLLGALFLFTAALFAFRIARFLTDSDWPGLVAGLAVATLWPMQWAMMSGMEVTFSVALTLAGVYYYLRFRTGWKAALGWVWLGVAVWSRPECLLLALLATLDSLVRRVVLKQRVVFWRGFAVYLLIVAPWFAFNLALSHSLFPQTYLAKAGKLSLFTAVAKGNTAQLTGLLTRAAPSYFTEFCVHLWRVNPILCLLVPVGLPALVVQGLHRKTGSGLLLPLMVLLYVPAMGLVTPVFGPAFQSGRYIGNVTALAAVTAAAGLAWLWTRLRPRALGNAVAGGLLTLALFNTITATVATVRNTTRAESSINRMQVALGRWLAGNTPEQASLACNDIGAIGYFSDRRIVDLGGIVTRDVIRYREAPDGDIQFIEHVKPDFLVIFPAGYPQLLDAPYVKAIARVDAPDNTASMFDFRPKPRSLAGILLLDLVVRPERAAMVVFKCHWESPGKPGTPRHF